VQSHASRYATRHTVRGLHFQTTPQTKLVRVAQGRIHDVVVDIRRQSPTYGQHASVGLAAGDWTQLLVPPGFAHGFCTLEADTEVAFLLDDYNDPARLRGLLWSDPRLGIVWPCGDAPGWLPEIDRGWPALAALQSPF
jgi:dTDP-4-dehydrorhamnose 3,5-epimerase